MKESRRERIVEEEEGDWIGCSGNDQHSILPRNPKSLLHLLEEDEHNNPANDPVEEDDDDDDLKKEKQHAKKSTSSIKKFCKQRYQTFTGNIDYIQWKLLN